VEDDKRSGCPSSQGNYENDEKVQNLVHSDSQPSTLCGNIEAIM
jgi:hypothetical protein